LIIDDEIYALIRMALAEDLGERGDVTSKATLPSQSHITGRIVAKAEGVIAGLPLIRAVYHQLDASLEIITHIEDGAKVETGTLIAEVTGSSYAVLAGERVMLNFLQRLSGVATLTAKFVEAISSTKAAILDTRKTTPGWRKLEKYAVLMGGGQNHRIGLYDMVLIKDNHIDAAGSISKAIEAAQIHPDAAGLPVVVEVRNEKELREALEFNVTRVLLDNMDLNQMREAVALVGGRVPLEASGNMSLERVRAVAETGVDYISVGLLTHSAPALDLSMKLSSVRNN
jgi:nicotinate-nucleotide pyrophosphorylase (carboxylating)